MLIGRNGFAAFSEYDLPTNLEHFLEQLQKKIEADSTLASADEEEYVQQKGRENALQGIEFDVANITVTQREENIPAEYFSNRFMMDDRRSYSKPVITFHLPFTGDAQVLRCRPSTRLMVADEIDVERGHVIFEAINFNNNADEVAAARDQVVKHLTEQAGHVNTDITAHNARLENFIRESVRGAKAKLKDQSDFLSKLGNKQKNG